MADSLEISPLEARAALSAPHPPSLIDCREEDEWQICRLAGAKLLPLSVFAERYRELLPDPAAPLLIYCHHGVRSLHAAGWLAGRGYTQVRSLAGGIDAWSLQVDPAIPRY